MLFSIHFDSDKKTVTPVVSVKFSDMVGQFRGKENFSEWLKKFELVLTL